MKFSQLLLALLISLPAYAYTLAPPPAPGSIADQEDFKVLHAYQSSRTSVQCAAAELQSDPTTESLFGPSTGILTTAELKQVQAQGDDLISKVFAIVDPFKAQFNRPRPYNEDKTIHPCISKPGGNVSYPSTHATAGIVVAAFLAQQFPAKSAAILQEGNQIGLNRVIGGVHHPSDVAAGQDLGKQVAKDLVHLQ